MNTNSTKTLWERCKELGERKTQFQDVILVFEHDEYIFLYDGVVIIRVAENSYRGSQWLAEAILAKFEGEAMLDKFGKALRESQHAEPVIPYRDADSSYVQISNNASQDQIRELMTYVLSLGKKGAKEKGFEYETFKDGPAIIVETKSLRGDWNIDVVSIGTDKFFYSSPFDFARTCEMLGFGKLDFKGFIISERLKRGLFMPSQEQIRDIWAFVVGCSGEEAEKKGFQYAEIRVSPEHSNFELQVSSLSTSMEDWMLKLRYENDVYSIDPEFSSDALAKLLQYAGEERQIR